MRQPDGLLDGMGHLDALRRPIRLPGDDDHAAVWEQPDLFVGSSPEDDGVPGGDRLEAAEIGRNVPEHVLPQPNHAVVGHRGYGDYETGKELQKRCSEMIENMTAFNMGNIDIEIRNIK